MEYFYAQRLRQGVDLQWVILGENNQERIHGERIQFFTPEFAAPMLLGRKRNMLNGLVDPRTDFILHWDDDDIYAIDRVQHQLDFHIAADVSVSGYHSLLYSKQGQVFRYNDPTNRPWCAGTSLLYTFEWWNKHRFVERQVGEDFFFCSAARNAGQLASNNGEEHIVARVHDDSTCHPKFGSRVFPMVPKLTARQATLLCAL